MKNGTLSQRIRLEIKAKRCNGEGEWRKALPQVCPGLVLIHYYEMYWRLTKLAKYRKRWTEIKPILLSSTSISISIEVDENIVFSNFEKNWNNFFLKMTASCIVYRKSNLVRKNVNLLKIRHFICNFHMPETSAFLYFRRKYFISFWERAVACWITFKLRRVYSTKAE